MDGISCLLHLSVTFGVESNISTDSSGSMKFSEMFSLLSPKLPSSMICSSMSAGSKVSRPSFSALVLLSPIRDLLGLPLPDCNCTCFFNLSTRSLFVPPFNSFLASHALINLGLVHSVENCKSSSILLSRPSRPLSRTFSVAAFTTLYSAIIFTRNAFLVP